MVFAFRMAEPQDESIIYLGSKQAKKNILNILEFKTSKSRLLNKSHTKGEIKDRLAHEKAHFND